MIEIKAFEYLMNNMLFYIGIIKAGDLAKNSKVDAWSMSNPSGYQRDLSQSRSKKFSEYLSKCKGIFHQTVLINVRNKDKVKFVNGILKVEGEFYLVDGQHRVGGLKLLLQAQPSFDSIPVPVLIMVGFNRESEAKEFLIVNKTQKGVRTDLSDRLLSHVISAMDKELLEVIGIREPKRLTELVIDICDKLNTNKKSVWYNRVTLPNHKQKATETIKQRSFTESLKQVVKDNYIQSNFKSINKLSSLLIDYWNVIKELCPKSCGDDAKNYVLLKTAGPFIMHKLLPIVVIKCGSNPTKTKMKNILSKIEQMADDDWHNKGELGEGSSQKFFNIKFDDFKSQIQ
ncbi:DGQHR domain-containing protein [Candidatus Woesearchaeota archaeon]|nr:DGQHR domain-containing protein [Candidatus Woesearchaeota archaeon]